MSHSEHGWYNTLLLRVSTQSTASANTNYGLFCLLSRYICTFCAVWVCKVQRRQWDFPQQDGLHCVLSVSSGSQVSLLCEGALHRIPYLICNTLVEMHHASCSFVACCLWLLLSVCLSACTCSSLCMHVHVHVLRQKQLCSAIEGFWHANYDNMCGCTLAFECMYACVVLTLWTLNRSKFSLCWRAFNIRMYWTYTGVLHSLCMHCGMYVFESSVCSWNFEWGNIPLWARALFACAL